MDLLQNWREQMVAQVKGERNHPSVMIWSIENEFLFINCINLYGNLMDQFEAEVTRTSDAVRAADPTRPTMVDGGGATKAQTLPVHGDHYVASEPQNYPDLAYAANATGGGRGRWTWDEQRPRFLGEDFFMAGNHPEVAYFEGDSAFSGKPVRGVGIWNRILQEGYRWAGYGAWQFWLGQSDTDQSQYVAYAARAVFSRDWNWTFAAGQTVPRTFAIFNDTRHADPITFAWTLTVDGKKAGGGSREYRVEPGTKLVVEEAVPMPKGKGRREGTFSLVLSVAGKEVFKDVKAMSVLDPTPRALANLDAKALVVFDPQGASAEFLTAQKVPFTRIETLDALPEAGKVLLVGKNALDAAGSASSRLAAYAAGDRRVIILEQQFPLRYQGLPAEMAAAENQGFTAFGEDAEHPALEGLTNSDFFTWGANKPLYRNAYEKPGRGARSLVQCDNRLRFTALAEVTVGKGLMLLCQLSVVENLDTNPVARQLFHNLLGAAASYRQEFHPVTAVVDGAPQLKTALDAIGLKYAVETDVLKSLAPPEPATAIVAASPANLKLLATHLPAVEAFTAKGGALVLCGLTPEGLADYNRIVGFEHAIRPGQRERVTLPPVRDRLTAGLTAGAVVLESSKRIFGFQAGNYVVSDMFSHVVDYDEIASFGQSDFHSYGNIVNGFVGSDGWPLIIDFPLPTNDLPFSIAIKLPKEETITEITYDPSVNYNPTTKIALLFDGSNRQEFTLPPTGDPQTFAIDPPRKARELTLQTCEWQIDPAKARNHGIDNVWIKVQRSPEFRAMAKPMLNVGGLMHYVKGNGHIVLCNLLFKDQEEVPDNVTKKRTILATILRNLKAPFAEGRTVVAGMNLAYQPVDIAKACNQYRDDKGWFGDKRFTFKDLPSGEQRLAGVKYNVYEMATSPVPNAILLGGRNVPGNLPAEVRGVAVGSKADALFFLHTARIDRRRSANDIKQGKTFELARYVVNYADGQKVEIPIVAEVDVEDYSQKAPAVLPGAQLAWVKPYEGTDLSAVAYSKQWANPRPDVVVQSIDILPGKDNAGLPAVLAITAARGE
jgi:beta-galactosidase